MTSTTHQFSNLTSQQQIQLKRGGISTLDELLHTSPKELAKKLKISDRQVEELVTAACRAAPCPQPRLLKDVKDEGGEMFTTGDATLDRALGGGIRTGMIWEVAGESAAGKTQFALQLSLFVQLPKQLQGLSGSACYLTTSSKLPTSRLLQIAQHHHLLSSTECGSDHIHTTPVPTIHALLQVLSRILPSFIKSKAEAPKPVKLVVIDALAELFHTSDRTSTATLVERSHNIVEISLLLHSIASMHQIAILVLNEVVDAFNYGAPIPSDGASTDLVYSEQSRFFGRAESIPGEGRKEAALGLVWANQVNARIMLSRTGRRRYIDETPVPESTVNTSNKRLRLETPQASSTPENTLPSAGVIDSDKATLIRRLSIIFSSVSAPASMDYIVTTAGISVIQSEDGEDGSGRSTVAPTAPPILAAEDSTAQTQTSQSSQFAPLDVGSIEVGRQELEEKQFDALTEGEAIDGPRADEDEWDQFWEQNQLTPAEVGTLKD